jgi:hypothetical protein
MAVQQIVFDNWAKGDFGRAYPAFNQVGGFRGRNVFLYPNGALGDRPPFYTLSVTGLPSKQVSHMIYNDAQGVMVVIFTTGAVWKFSPTSGGAATSVGTVSSPVPNDVVSSGNSIYGVRTSGANGLVSINLATNTITDVAAAPLGHLIQVYGVQWIIVNTTGSTPNRLNYSALGDPTSWPGNFTDVGDLSAIQKVFVQRNSLSIPKADGTWWNVSGVLGSETVRRVERGLNFASPSTLSFGENIWWVNGRDMGVFSGAQVRTELRPDEPYAGGAPGFENGAEDIAPLAAADDVVLVGTAKATDGTDTIAYAQARIGGTWSRHTLPVGTLPNAAGSNLFIEPMGQGKVLLCVRGRTGGAGDSAPTFYIWQPRDEFPNISQRTDGTSAAPVSASFDTPEFWPEDGSRCLIREVMVDFIFDYEQATPETSLVGMTVSAEALNRVGRDDGQVSNTQTWIPNSETRTTSTPAFRFVRQRAIFSFGDQGEGAGGVVHFTSLKSVAIFRVILIVETMPPVYTP